MDKRDEIREQAQRRLSLTRKITPEAVEDCKVIAALLSRLTEMEKELAEERVNRESMRQTVCHYEEQLKSSEAKREAAESHMIERGNQWEAAEDMVDALAAKLEAAKESLRVERVSVDSLQSAFTNQCKELEAAQKRVAALKVSRRYWQQRQSFFHSQVMAVCLRVEQAESRLSLVEKERDALAKSGAEMLGIIKTLVGDTPVTEFESERCYFCDVEPEDEDLLAELPVNKHKPACAWRMGTEKVKALTPSPSWVSEREKELESALKEAQEYICSLCKRVNPQHAKIENCTCDDLRGIQKLIARPDAAPKEDRP